MARSGSSEYAGTTPSSGDASGGSGDGLERVSIADAGGDASGGELGGDGLDADLYQRNQDGSVKRNADGSPRRKRGRKGTGSGSSGSASKNPVSVSGIEALLFSTHAILSAALHTPELALEKTESQALAEATANVARHYPTSISAKTIDWAALATCLAFTYGPRAVMIRQRLDAEREQRSRNSRREEFAPLQPVN